MRRAKRRNLTTYDVLIIASMVEREAQLAKERPIIAAVIHNRLREGMPLGIDATIRYATRNWSEPLKQSELRIDSPYNTRRRTGLPPTPIGSPGPRLDQGRREPGEASTTSTTSSSPTATARTTSPRPTRSSSATSRPTTASASARGGKSPASSDG